MIFPTEMTSHATFKQWNIPIKVSPSPEVSEDESDDVSDSADDAEDDDDDLPSDDEMSTWFTCPSSLVTKMGSNFEMRVVILIGGGLV